MTHRVSRYLFPIVLSAGLMISPLYAQPGQTKKNSSTLQIAKDHYQFEEYNQAIPYLQDLVKGDPDNAKYNFWLGKSLYLTYKKNQALPYLEKVERLDPAVDKEFHLYYGLTLHYNLKYDRAVEQYRLDAERYQPGSKEYVASQNRIAQCVYAKKLARKKEGEQVKIVNMGDMINTEYSEHSPVISANDSVLIYTARRPECLGADPDTYFYDEDVYVAHRKNGVWTQGENIGTPVNSRGHDATISLTADGQTLFFYRHKKAGGLFVADFDPKGEEWKEPRLVDKPLNSKYYEASICVSADSSTIFFTSDRPGGLGGRDIYMVRKTGKNEWSQPQNLGAPINTPFDEDAPYFHPDGKTLYYSSNGPASTGGFDIFVTELDSAASNGWLAPLNMGWPVNTPDDDIYFVLSASGKNGYYSSGKEGGYGEKDIYHIEFPYYPYPRRYFIVELAGMMQDVQNLDTLSGVIRLYDKASGTLLDSIVTTADSQNFYFILEPEMTYTLAGEVKGYNPVTMDFTVPRLNGEDMYLVKNLMLDAPVPAVPADVPAPPARIEVMNIYFDFDKYDLREESRAELDEVARILKDNPEMNLEVMGHTDWFGTYDYNVKLSDNRSKAAYNYLLKKGIAPSRLSMGHFSENSPLEVNENDEGRQYNRRVEFRFVKGSEAVLASRKLRTGVEGVRVDHTTPKGEPGFDKPADGTAPVSPAPIRSEGTAPAASDHAEYTLPSGNTRSAAVTEAAAAEPTATVRSAAPETQPAAGPRSAAAAAPAPAAEADLNSLDLHHIYFDFDKSDLRDLSRSELDKLAALLKANTALSLDISGHTDAMGDNSYNQILSERRCQAARSYLLQAGVPEAQITLNGFSEDKPLDTNDHAAGRQHNRRVEFRIVKQNTVLMNSIP